MLFLSVAGFNVSIYRYKIKFDTLAYDVMGKVWNPD